MGNALIHALRYGDFGSRLRVAALLLLLVACVFGGGASRADVLSQSVVRIAAVIVLAICATSISKEQLRPFLIPVLFLLGIAALMLLQLIPLPPALWASLPGRAEYYDVAVSAGVADAWRPVSFTPDLTLNSLLSVLPPLAMVIVVASLQRPIRHSLAPLLILIILLSALIGVMQLVSGGDALYFYRVTNRDAPVGVFANRNHQAVFLTMALPLLAVWAFSPSKHEQYRLYRAGAAMAAALFFVAMILITGSRAGLLLGVVGALFAVILVRAGGTTILGQQSKSMKLIVPYLIVGTLSLVVISAYALSRAEAIQRLFLANIGTDQRFMFISTTLEMFRDFFPLGSGLGSFEAIFRGYEPFEGLSYQYFNHAHNDFVEFAIEAGLLGILLLSGFLGWILAKSVKVWRLQAKGSMSTNIARLASLLLLMLMGASTVDYPLRTPLMAIFAAILTCWLCDDGSARDPRHARRVPPA